MKFEHTEVFNFEGAFRGMRNPLESWSKSDSKRLCDGVFIKYELGEYDLNLAQKLIKAGPEHAKFLRQIFVSVDITAPLYWWKEADTYKVGTTANSTSTMHKIASRPIALDCFETDDLKNPEKTNFITVIDACERLRLSYLRTGDKDIWKALIRILPESWLQTRTVTMSYANLRNMISQRMNHKLTEWHSFIDWARELPYAEELLFFNLRKESEKVLKLSYDEVIEEIEYLKVDLEGNIYSSSFAHEIDRRIAERVNEALDEVISTLKDMEKQNYIIVKGNEDDE